MQGLNSGRAPAAPRRDAGRRAARGGERAARSSSRSPATTRSASARRARGAQRPYRTRSPFVLDACELARFDADAWRLCYDLDVLRALELEAGRRPRVRGRAARRPRRLLQRLGRRGPRDLGAGRRDAHRAATSATRPAARTSSSAVGHAHLDTAWLWPLEETLAQGAAHVRDPAAADGRVPRAPLLRLAGAALRVGRASATRRCSRASASASRAGSGSPVGGTWVEPDCNLPVRRVARPPAPVRPALLRARARPPLHGAVAARRVRLHRPAPAAHARRPGIDALPHAEALVEPLQPARAPHVHVAGARRQRGAHALPAGRHLQRRGDGRRAARATCAPTSDHDRSRHSLLVFGHGDGGGGPTRAMLERLRRARDLRGLPRDDAAPPGGVLRRARGRRAATLRTVVGELYFEYHRGTYTIAGGAQARQPPLRGARCTTPSCSARSLRGSGARRTRAPSSPRRGACCCSTSSTTSCPGTLDHRGQRARAGRPRRRRGARRRARGRGARPRSAATATVPVNTTRGPAPRGRRATRRRARARRRRRRCGAGAVVAPGDGDAVARRAHAPTAASCSRTRTCARRSTPDGAVALARAPRDRPRGARRARQPPRALRGPPGRLGRVGRRPVPPRDARGLPAGRRRRRHRRATRCAPRSPSSARSASARICARPSASTRARGGSRSTPTSTGTRTTGC